MVEEIHLQKPWTETEREDYEKTILELTEIARNISAKDLNEDREPLNE